MTLKGNDRIDGPGWYVDWEYAATITACGPFHTWVNVLAHLQSNAELMSKSGYGEPLEAIEFEYRA